jgi:hypothetical protein
MDSIINFAVVEPGHPLRKRAEIFITSIYTNEYSAIITDFPERIGISFDGGGKILSACSIRVGQNELFSSHYLNTSQLKKIKKYRLIEITTLASTSRLGLWVLLAGATNLGRNLSCNAMIFTATKKLRTILNRACLGIEKIAKADRSKISNANQWGTYYESDPWVCLVKDSGQFSQSDSVLQAS